LRAAIIARRLGGNARRRGQDRSAIYFDERAEEDERHADVLRQVLREIPAMSVAGGDGSPAIPDSSAT
jgi:hypothetical protein